MSEENNIIIETNDMIVELNDCVTFWGTIIGNPASNSALVNYLNNLLSNKQDLFYYIVNTETDKNNIPNKKTGNMVFVKNTKCLYIYDEQLPSEWILVTQDLSIFYTKTETDDLLALKANISDVYSKIDADEKFATSENLESHINNKQNPHEVNKSQVGLGNVANLSPADMPISNATQYALNNKQNLITGAVSNVTSINLPANKVVVTNSEGKLDTDDEIDVSRLELLEGATFNIQDQLDDKEPKFSKNTAFNKNFSTNVSEIKMNGEASLGVSSQIPRVDHIHPSDTKKVDANPLIIGGTFTKVTFDSKGLVTGGSNLQVSDIPNLNGIYEVLTNKVNTLTNSSIEYPTTRAVTNAISNKVNKDYVDEQVYDLTVELNNKENSFDKNSAFNKDFENDAQGIKMDGEANAGSSNKVARSDHIHPTDTSREAVVNKTDSYSYNSPTLYPSTRALYNGLNTRLKPTNVIGGNRINVVVDGDKIILNAYGGTTSVEWGGIVGDINNQADLMQILNGKIGLDSLSSEATGLLYNNTTGVFSLDEDYVIPTQTTLNNLQRNFTFAEKGITKTTSSYSTIDLAKEIAALKLDMSTTLFGEVTLNDMPTGIGNAEMKVEVQQRSGSTSVLAFTLTSTNVAPHQWEFYWVGTGTSGSPATTEWYATVREDMVLTRTNTSSYTPTGDYNPATKKYVDDIIPTQSGNSGKFLTTDGSAISWATVDALPSQTSQSGKFLTTDGSTASWADVPTEIPTQTGNSGKFLTTNGTAVSWASVDALPSQSGQSGKFLTTDGSNASWAAALTSSDVVNSVNSTATNVPLSANMGKELQDQITHLQGIGRFLALWNTATGLAETNPPTSPYTYKSGDYFIVGTVATGSDTNYKPNGASYTTGTASVTVETETVKVGYVYYYDGTNWKLQPNEAGTVTDVQVNGTSVVTNGVGNIPKAASNVLGTIMIGSGLAIQSNGSVYIVSATESNLVNKLNGSNPVVSTNLDIAVREGLGNNSLTWTDAYKQNARNTIGAPNKTIFRDWVG